MISPYRILDKSSLTKEEFEWILIPHSFLGEEYIYWTKYPNLSKIIEISNIDQILRVNLIGGAIKFLVPPKQKWHNLWTADGWLTYIRYERFV